MSDFTIEYMQQCQTGTVNFAKSLCGKYNMMGLGNERFWPT